MQTFKELYAELTAILNQDDAPDLEKVSLTIYYITFGGLFPPIFDGIAAALAGNGDLEAETHKLRAIWRMARWDRAEYSRHWLENRDRAARDYAENL